MECAKDDVSNGFAIVLSISGYKSLHKVEHVARTCGRLARRMDPRNQPPKMGELRQSTSNCSQSFESAGKPLKNIVLLNEVSEFLRGLIDKPIQSCGLRYSEIRIRPTVVPQKVWLWPLSLKKGKCLLICQPEIVRSLLKRRRTVCEQQAFNLPAEERISLLLMEQGGEIANYL